MSSIISRNKFMPTTSLGETNRQIDSAIMAFPGIDEGIRQAFGTIKQVHAEKPLVRAYDDDGSDIANSRWIPLTHSTQEIAERFGTIRLGMRVVVLFTGPDGGSASATIIGTEGERNLSHPFLPNSVDRSWFRIFTPGRGF